MSATEIGGHEVWARPRDRGEHHVSTNHLPVVPEAVVARLRRTRRERPRRRRSVRPLRLLGVRITPPGAARQTPRSLTASTITDDTDPVDGDAVVSSTRRRRPRADRQRSATRSTPAQAPRRRPPATPPAAARRSRSVSQRSRLPSGLVATADPARPRPGPVRARRSTDRRAGPRPARRRIRAMPPLSTSTAVNGLAVWALFLAHRTSHFAPRSERSRSPPAFAPARRVLDANLSRRRRVRPWPVARPCRVTARRRSRC